MEEERVACKSLFLLRHDSGFQRLSRLVCSLLGLGYLKTKSETPNHILKTKICLKGQCQPATLLSTNTGRSGILQGSLSVFRLSLKDGNPIRPRSESYRGSDFS